MKKLAFSLIAAAGLGLATVPAQADSNVFFSATVSTGSAFFGGVSHVPVYKAPIIHTPFFGTTVIKKGFVSRPFIGGASRRFIAPRRGFVNRGFVNRRGIRGFGY